MILAAIVLVAWSLWLPWTIYKSLRVFFEARRIAAFMMTMWLGLVLIAGVVVYSIVLCWLTLFSLRGLQLPI